MRSLTTKLTLAFLLIGILGAALVAGIITTTIRAEFNRFVVAQGAEQISTDLEAYYVANGGWSGVESSSISKPRWGGFQLVDVDGNVLAGWPDQDVAPFPNEILLEVDGEQIGTLFTRGDEARFGGREDTDVVRSSRVSPEALFLNNVRRSSLIGAGVAVVVALLAGVLLSRGLTRPVRALTDATQKNGEW